MIFLVNDPDKNWKERFQKFADFYHSDFANPKSLDAELPLWEHYWTKFTDCRPNNISETLKSISKTYSRSTMVTDRLNSIALMHVK